MSAVTVMLLGQVRVHPEGAVSLVTLPVDVAVLAAAIFAVSVLNVAVLSIALPTPTVPT